MTPERDWSHLVKLAPDALVSIANERAEALGLTPSTNEHRNVVNMLRHDFSGYDEKVRSARTDHLYASILDAIAADFPWLAEQCERDKSTHASRLPQWAQHRRGTHVDAAAKQRSARDKIKGLAVGDLVMVRWHGPREATIVEVRRTRVKAAFVLPDGTEQIVDRSADEVQPVGVG